MKVRGLWSFIGVLFFSLSVHADAPERLGLIPSAGAVSDVVINSADGYAYLASRSFGLSIIDVSNPAQPKPVGVSNISFYGNRIAVSQNLAIVSSSTYQPARVLNITDQTHPTVVASITAGAIQAVAMEPNRPFAYLVDLVPGNPPRSELVVVDLTVPANPVVLKRITISSNAQSLAIAGGYLYVSNGQIFKISTPGNTELIRAISIPTTGSVVPNMITIAGNYAYINNGVLYPIKISDPYQAAIVGTPFANSLVAYLHAQGTKIYGVAGDTLKVIDIANPEAPALVATQTDRLKYNAQSVFASGSMVYLGNPNDSFGGLVLVNVSNPSSPVWISSYNGGKAVADIALSNTTAIAAENDFGIEVIDVSNPSAPEIIGNLKDGSNSFKNISLEGNLASALQLVPGNPSRTDMVTINLNRDAWNHTAPSISGRMTIGGSSAAIVQRGSRAYALTGVSLLTIDIQNPAAPSILGTATISAPPAYAMEVANGYAYIAAAQHFYIYDLYTQNTPILTASLPVIGKAVAVSEHRAYVIAGTYVTAIDITDPFHPAVITTLPDLTGEDIKVAGNLLILDRVGLNHTIPNEGIYFYDVTDLNRPILLKRLIPAGPSRNLVLANGYLYASDDVARIDIISLPVSLPTPTPVPVPKISIHGVVRHYWTGDAVSGVQVQLINTNTQAVLGTQTTDGTGQYTFASIATGYTLSIVMSKQSDPASGVSALDAAYIVQLVVGKRSFSARQRLAGDTTGDGSVSALDASNILQLVAGRISRFPAATLCGSDWTFVQTNSVPPTLASGCPYNRQNLGTVNSSIPQLTTDAILIGDVTGDWVGP